MISLMAPTVLVTSLAGSNIAPTEVYGELSNFGTHQLTSKPLSIVVLFLGGELDLRMEK